MATDNQNMPKLNRNEAEDFGKKLTAFRKQLSPTQSQYLGYALRSVTGNISDVQGYDQYEYYQVYVYDGGNTYLYTEVDDTTTGEYAWELDQVS